MDMRAIFIVLFTAVMSAILARVIVKMRKRRKK